MKRALIVREMPAVLPGYACMRYHAGTVEKRPALVPIYESLPDATPDAPPHAGKRVVEYRPSEIEEVPCFHLMGFGKTEGEARKMAEAHLA